ncbi:hypothetical protein DNU06_05740 [Putridiphycobacter roseus]|uniref:Uncharacterized protein n=1 Tax=Putridiphycobacter roseus TaxID=2219161 RepID=A0A2W1N1H8_9FLAO|nr:hypothetical protein [Putridiphycobacter roseus]PZE18117.1 hypothetical protein DNU06_05740 [Putridiphycobacter roseus]
MKTKILILTTALFILTSCGDNKPTINKQESLEKIATENPYGLVLNQGKKWQVNPEMMQHVKSMEADIKSYADKNLSTYSELGKKLNGHIRGLTSSCTMKGQSHEELHKWLLPFIDLKKEFIQSASAEEYQVNYQKIVAAMEIFNQYFA